MKTKNKVATIKDVRQGRVLYVVHPYIGDLIEEVHIRSTPRVRQYEHWGYIYARAIVKARHNIKTGKAEDWGSVESDASLRDMGVRGAEKYGSGNGSHSSERRAFRRLKHAVAYRAMLKADLRRKAEWLERQEETRYDW